MIIEKTVLVDLVDEFITKNCNPIFPEESKFHFKTYLKKDENNCFTVVDKENCIKCIFEKEFLKSYFSAYPSYVKLEHYDGMLIMIKKAFFDVLQYKNVNRTISYRVVLIIKEFDLDSAQKMNNDIYNSKYKNVNFEPRIEQHMTTFIYNYVKSQIESQEEKKKPREQRKKYYFNHDCISATNFIKKNFIPVNNVGSLYSILPEDANIWFLNSKNIEDFDGINDYDGNGSYTLKEIEIGKKDFDDDVIDDNITVENLQKLDFSSLFCKEPSAIKEDSTIIGSKRKRSDSDLSTLPISLQNLIKRMEKQPMITKYIYEKYMTYKRYNSNEYKKDNS